MDKLLVLRRRHWRWTIKIFARQNITLILISVGITIMAAFSSCSRINDVVDYKTHRPFISRQHGYGLIPYPYESADHRTLRLGFTGLSYIYSSKPSWDFALKTNTNNIANCYLAHSLPRELVCKSFYTDFGNFEEKRIIHYEDDPMIVSLTGVRIENNRLLSVLMVTEFRFNTKQTDYPFIIQDFDEYQFVDCETMQACIGRIDEHYVDNSKLFSFDLIIESDRNIDNYSWLLVPCMSGSRSFILTNINREGKTDLLPIGYEYYYIIPITVKYNLNRYKSSWDVRCEPKPAIKEP